MLINIRKFLIHISFSCFQELCVVFVFIFILFWMSFIQLRSSCNTQLFNHINQSNYLNFRVSISKYYISIIYYASNIQNFIFLNINTVLNGQCLHGSKRFTALWFTIFFTTFSTIALPYSSSLISFLPFGIPISLFRLLTSCSRCRFGYFLAKNTISSSSFLP